jgi:RNA polymerase sigma factor (sigma-70 family)
VSGGEQLDDDGDLRGLARAHGRAVRYVVSRFERDRSDVDDIVADVFRLALEHLAALRTAAPEQQRSWLLRTARYLASNHVRRAITRRRLRERLMREPLTMSPGADEEIATADQNDAVHARSRLINDVLAGIRADYRQVLVLDALGYQGPAIGGELGVSANAARKRLMRARLAFRAAYLASLGESAEAPVGSEECPDE